MTDPERIFVALAEIVGEALDDFEIADLAHRVAFHNMTADLAFDI